MSEAFYSVARVADQLGLHPKTVLRLIREGAIRATRIGKSYRIARSDFEALSGARPQSVLAPVRATCTFDLTGLGVEAADRLSSMLTAAVVSRETRPDPVHLSTAYDPTRRTLKVVIVAEVMDAAALLRTAHALFEAQP